MHNSAGSLSARAGLQIKQVSSDICFCVFPHSHVIRDLRCFLIGCCCGPCLMRRCSQKSHGFKQSCQGALCFFVPLLQRLRLRSPLCRWARVLFLLCFHADLLHFFDTGFLSFSACRTTENLTLFFGPPLYDAGCVELMVTCGSAAWFRCLDL